MIDMSKIDPKGLAKIPALCGHKVYPTLAGQRVYPYDCPQCFIAKLFRKQRPGAGP
jgi:hypothetical protein